MSLNSPKRSHSLVHHQQKQKQQHQHQQPQQTHQEEQHVNRLQPCIIQPPQRSSSVREHQPVRLARSSSLSHLSRKVGLLLGDVANTTDQWQHDIGTNEIQIITTKAQW